MAEDNNPETGQGRADEETPKPAKAHWQPTRDQQDEMTDYVVALLSRGLFKSQIKKAFLERFLRPDKQPLSARTFEDYLTRAREAIVAATGKSKEEWRTESLAFYLAIQQDGNATPREKLLARERIDKLIGVDAAPRAPEDGDGKPVAPQVVVYIPDNGRGDRQS